MNRTAKVILAIVTGLLVICLCTAAVGLAAMYATGRVLTETVYDDPVSVVDIGASIAAYSMPAGFNDASAASLADFSLVTFTTDDGRSHISLFQVPDVLELDRHEIEDRFQDATNRDKWAEAAVVDRIPCQIRGQQTTLLISEGINHEGRHYRSASALFDGNGGTALVNIVMPSAAWDQDMVETFIQSLH